MEIKEFIDSGILELYVFGKTSESENEEVHKMAKEHQAVSDEIQSIERAVVSLSYSMSPYLSAHNYEVIREKLLLNRSGVVDIKPKSSYRGYLGWAAAIVLMVGAAYQYTQLETAQNKIVIVETEKTNLKKNIDSLQFKNQKTENVLAVIRDENNTIIPLAGQTVAPEAKAKVYWNKETQVVYVDASGLPEPPEGMVYQVWSLKLAPVLTPTSIGLLADFTSNDSKIFEVNNTSGAEAFGITLEPAGGSASPTLEQLYTLGKV